MGFYESVKGYVQGRKYERLDPSVGRRGHLRIAKMGSRKQRIWRLKLLSRLKLKLLSRLKLKLFKPNGFLVKFRDAYMNMMMNVSNSRVFSSEMVRVYSNPLGQRCVKEYDRKVLAEMHNLYLNQGQELHPQVS